MRKLFIPLIVSVVLQLLPQFTCAQDAGDGSFIDPNQSKIDSLLNAIEPDSPDSVRAKNYSRVANLTCDLDTSLKYASLSLDYCPETNLELLAFNYNILAFAYYMKDESRKALKYRLMSADIYKKLNDKRRMAGTFIHVGNCYFDLNVKDSIFYYYNQALVYLTELQDTNFIVESYNNLGQIYFSMSLYDNAVNTYRKALNYALSFDVNDSRRTVHVADCYCYLGITMSLQSDTLINQAIENLTKAVNLYDSCNTVKHYDVEQKHYAYYGLAGAFIKEAKLTGKKAYADSCYKYVKKAGDYYLAVGSYSNYVDCQYCYVDYLIFYKRYREALAELLGLEKYLTADRLNIYESHYKYLYEVYKHLGDYKNALDCHEKYMDYKMAYVNDSTLNSIKNAEVERTHMLDSVNHHFETLRIETEHRQELMRTRMRTRVLLSIALMFILVGVILFFFYKTTKENEENKLRNKALEVERSLLRTQMNPHFIFNALNSVQSFILNSNAPEAVRFLSKFAKLMRMILNNSMVQSVTLADEMQSLSLYLDLERARFDNKFNYSIDISGNIDEDLVHVPPMLVQPFIENAIIHGIMHKTDGEGLITIKITANDADSIICQITDNGVGRKMAAELEKNNERKHKSVGMQLTRDRLRDLNNEANAKMSCVITDLEDETGNALGTQVTVIIPMVESKEEDA